jgi:hypothetical protein
MLKLFASLFALTFAAPAMAQSGHFVTGGGNAPFCTDEGTTVLCDGKVAGLGGTEFEILVEADGVAEIECRNPGGNVAPGQDTSVEVAGTTGPIPTPRNGNYNFEVETVAPSVPNTPTCPNRSWTAEVVDVAFTTAVLSLFEDGVLVDEMTLLVNGD